APIGLTRKPTVEATSAMPPPQAAGKTGPSMRSGGLFFLGISLVVFGVAVVAIPSFLVLGDQTLLAEGAAVVALGIFLGFQGGRPA
ncbi:MAG TPA: hypothetical protein VJR06_03780, partial [Nitrososphaerales archaeon]|nr:hypothetical protein [Nitrososphaerales archaeon]